MSTTVERSVEYAGFGSDRPLDDGKYPDILGFLLSQFDQAEAEKGAAPVTKKAREQVLKFLEFGRALLDKDLPRTMRYAGSGFALELQSGKIVAFSTKDAAIVDHRGGSVPIMVSKSQPGQAGGFDTGSVPITTGHTRPDYAAQNHVPVQVPVASKPAGGRKGKPS